MTEKKKKIEVSLLGQRFAVRTDRDESHVKMLADFVSRQLEQVRRTTRTISTHHLALLVALNLADRLFMAEEKQDRLKKELKAVVSGALDDLDLAIESLQVEKGKPDTSSGHPTIDAPSNKL